MKLVPVVCGKDYLEMEVRWLALTAPQASIASQHDVLRPAYSSPW
jgi:hypothetical protein